ncbi:hypothetical protein EVAR_20216_1 [Eumeta japonica]|uniref:Uncharacterized protein n=1 Tax=Eumeta variegata TaxID=151549 RepID=A0A4C1WAQ3_EUMVA|nr:hypothetical protein EVAR_20216_1 [Eumeta japonica]
MGEGTATVYFASGAAGGDKGNGYRLLSARGMQTLQCFLREHGADCVRQFMQSNDIGGIVHILMNELLQLQRLITSVISGLMLLAEPLATTSYYSFRVMPIKIYSHNFFMTLQKKYSFNKTESRCKNARLDILS